MRKTLLLAALALVAAVSPRSMLSAQRTGVISGTVRDEAGKPVPDADVVASADNARARTDSAGHFEIRNLDDGTYAVRARRLGYLPARMTVDISHGGRATLSIELRARPALLDSIVVVADGKCPDRSYSGFVCRRKAGKGVYFTDDDIFDKNARELGDIFRDVPGFRIEFVSTQFGRLPSPIPTRASQCLNALVNGRPAASTNPLPRFADEMIAVEIYASPSDVPEEYQRYVWGVQGRQSQSYHQRAGSPSDRCSLVVYWTRFV
jgi:hypothetical protein